MNVNKHARIFFTAVAMVLLSVLVFSGCAKRYVRPTSPPSTATAAAKAGAQSGVQEISSDLTPGGGYPNITVKKGIPVRWTLKAKAGEISGCNRTLIIPKYNIERKLQVGDNLIEFTPADSGNITYSCWMGMITATITVEDSQS